MSELKACPFCGGKAEAVACAGRDRVGWHVGNYDGVWRMI